MRPEAWNRATQLRPATILLLALCGFWVAALQAMLFAALLWIEPRRAVVAAGALARAGAALVAGLWAAPGAAFLAAAALLAGALVFAAFLLVAKRLLSATSKQREVQRG